MRMVGRSADGAWYAGDEPSGEDPRLLIQNPLLRGEMLGRCLREMIGAFTVAALRPFELPLRALKPFFQLLESTKRMLSCLDFTERFRNARLCHLEPRGCVGEPFHLVACGFLRFAGGGGFRGGGQALCLCGSKGLVATAGFPSGFLECLEGPNGILRVRERALRMGGFGFCARVGGFRIGEPGASGFKLLSSPLELFAQGERRRQGPFGTLCEIIRLFLPLCQILEPRVRIERVFLVGDQL